MKQRRNSTRSCRISSFTWEPTIVINASGSRKAESFDFASKLLLILLLTGGAVGLGIAFRSEWLLPKPVVTAQSQFATLEQNPINHQPTDPKIQSEAIIKTLLDFINAPDHESRLSYMYEQVNAVEELEDFYEKRQNTLPEKILNPSVSAITLAGKQLFLVSFLDQNMKSLTTPFEWVRDGYRIHWEAMTG